MKMKMMMMMMEHECQRGTVWGWIGRSGEREKKGY
jgi:hypothetical protein